MQSAVLIRAHWSVASVINKCILLVALPLGTNMSRILNSDAHFIQIIFIMYKAVNVHEYDDVGNVCF